MENVVIVIVLFIRRMKNKMTRGSNYACTLKLSLTVVHYIILTYIRFQKQFDIHIDNINSFDFKKNLFCLKFIFKGA